MTTWIQTRSGKAFDLINPDPRLIDIEDIAHALAHICRFTGHTTLFYSVAEHSVHVTQMVEDEDLKLVALLHDAAEAYIGDVSAPLKRLDGMSGYRAVEAGIWRAICKRFGFAEELPHLVKEADAQMLANEGATLWSPGHVLKWGLKHQPHLVTLNHWAPYYARDRFLKEYNRLL